VTIQVVEVSVPSPIALVEVPVPPRIRQYEVQIPGIPGPMGQGSSLDFIQSSALPVWTVAHNLGYRPIVSVYSTGGVEIIGGEIVHLSVNTLQITFDIPFAGAARCV
jgi:hypothetical protein